MLEIGIYVFLLLGIFLIFGSAAYAGLKASPWLPAFKKDMERILKLSGVKEGDVVYDLGSGDGRILIALANNTKARLIVGYEISFLLYLWSVINIWFKGFSKRIEVRFGDFLSRDLGQADVIFCFLTPKGMKKLGPKFKRELRKGTRIISYTFSIPGWEPVSENRIGDQSVPIFTYVID